MVKIISNVEYNKEVIKDLNRNHFNYKNRRWRRTINVIAVLYALVNISMLSLGIYDYFTYSGILAQFIVLALVIISNTNIFADISTMLFLRTDKLSLGLKSEMTFEKEKVTVINKTENMTLEYDKLYKIMETKEYMYLYLNKVQALIVVKENNSKEELEELRNILKSTVKKYIVYMK